MTITYTIVHRRPNTDSSWFNITDEMQSRIDHFKSTGDIVSFNTVQDSDLQSTTTLVFKDDSSESAVITDPDWVTFRTALETAYSNSSITHTETRTEE